MNSAASTAEPFTPRVGTINRRRSDGGLTIRDFRIGGGFRLSIGKDYGTWTTPDGVTSVIEYGEEA